MQNKHKRAATGDGITNPDGKTTHFVESAYYWHHYDISKQDWICERIKYYQLYRHAIIISFFVLTSLTASTPTFVTFTVKSGNSFISEAT